MTDSTEQIETEQEAVSLGNTPVELWHKKIKKQLELEKQWRGDAKEAEAIYEAKEKSNNYFNILHSNVETLTPALYNTQPVPDVRRRWGGSDIVAKNVADVSERMISYSLDKYDFDEVATSFIKDGLVAGRGVSRLRYQPELDEAGNIIRQHTRLEPVAWDRFIIGPAQKWSQVPWIAFIHYLGRKELMKLSPAKGEMVPLNVEEGQDRDEKDLESKGIFKSAKVYEIWDRESKSVIFIADGVNDFPLSVEPDPLGLAGFFPAPEPFQPLKRLRSTVPICPYQIYKDLIIELNVVTKRIKALVNQLKVRGIYDSKLEAELRLLQDAYDGEYFACKDASQFATGQGGLDKAVHHWPMSETIAALAQLYQQREQIKATIYEVTGISDILRGASEAKETATAQRIKTQWGSLRVQTMQGEVARIAKQAFRMKVDIFSNHYSPETISQVTSLPTEKEEPFWPQVIQTFKSDMASFRVDIETDSTIRADLTRSQESMNQFLQATGAFAQAMGGIVQVAPQVVPAAIEVYTAFARNFKLGKQAEDALDQLQQKAPELMKQAQQGGKEDGKDSRAEQQAQAAKMQAEMQGMQAKQQLEQQAMQAKQALEQQKNEYELKCKQIEAQVKQMQLREQRMISEIKLMIEQARAEKEGINLEGKKFELNEKQKLASGENNGNLHL